MDSRSTAHLSAATATVISHRSSSLTVSRSISRRGPAYAGDGRELQRLGLPHDRVEGVQAVRVRQAAQRTPLILAQQLASAHIAAARAERVRPRGAGLGVAKGQALPILFVVVSPETQGAPGEIQAVVERRRGDPLNVVSHRGSFARACASHTPISATRSTGGARRRWRVRMPAVNN